VSIAHFTPSCVTRQVAVAFGGGGGGVNLCSSSGAQVELENKGGSDILWQFPYQTCEKILLTACTPDAVPCTSLKFFSIQ
jgi:hypothetical protein